jgi:RNA polymerase-binding transcription factor DksA
MDEVRDRIEKELGSVMDRLRQLGGAVVIEEFPGALGDNSPFSDPTEEVQVQGEREVSFATRSLLVERANRLAEALDRLREGEYGTCEECGEPIAPARLKAMPEVTTCVRCQDKLERLARRLEPAAVLFGEPEEED